VVFDVIAIAIWVTMPATRTRLNLGFEIVSLEAAVAAALFALTLIGLLRRQKWAPSLAIAVPIAQRIFGTFVFFPSPAIAITLAWSLLIIYSAYIDMKTISGAGVGLEPILLWRLHRVFPFFSNQRKTCQYKSDGDKMSQAATR
jgi:hypothetical protein